MKPVCDVVSTEVIEALWEAGYTILPRRRGSDPFEIDQKFIPQGRAYQWFHLVHDKVRFEHTGWAQVPASRHDGYFMPAGTAGAIEVNGLGLFEKPKDEVDKELAENANKAHKLVDDWIAKTGAEFSGHIKAGDEAREVGHDKRIKDAIKESTGTFANPETKTIDTIVQIPRDMAHLIKEILDERDLLEGEVVQKDRTLKPGEIADRFYAAVEADPCAPWWPTLRAILLPMAIDNVRAKHGMERTLLRRMKDEIAKMQQNSPALESGKPSQEKPQCTCGLMTGECKRAGCPNQLNQEKPNE